MKNIFNNIYAENDLFIILLLQDKLVNPNKKEERAVTIEIAKTASLTVSNKSVQYRQVLKTLKKNYSLLNDGKEGDKWVKSNSCHVLNNILKNLIENRVSAIVGAYWPIQFHHYSNISICK